MAEQDSMNGAGSLASNAPNPYADDTNEEYAAKMQADPEKPKPKGDHPVQTFWDKILHGVKGQDNTTMGRTAEVLRGVTHGVAQAGMEAVKTIGEGAAYVDRKTGLGEALSPGYNDTYDSKGAKGVVADATGDGQEVIDHYLGRRTDDPLASFTESATQFMAGWAATGELKGLAALSGKASVAAGLARGAVVDGTMFDPYQAQLAELAAKAPLPIAKQLGQLLSVKGDDSAVVARLKRAAAGLIPAATIEGLVAASRVVRAGKSLAKDATPEAVKEVADHAATVDAAAAGELHPEGMDFIVNPRTLKIDPVMPKTTANGMALPAISLRSQVSEDAATATEATPSAAPTVAPEKAPAEAPASLPPNGQGFTSPVFSDYTEASQQAESINAALNARKTAGQVDEGVVKNTTDNVAKALESPTPENLGAVSDGDLNLSYHTTGADATKIANDLAEKFAKQVRQTVEKQGEVHVEQSMRMALNGLGEIPQNQVHGVMTNLLERMQGQSATKMAADYVMKSYSDNILRLTEAVEARPHDVVSKGELRTAMQNYFDFQDTFQAANSDAARALRLGQERPKLNGSDVQFAEDGVPAAKPAAQTPLNPADVRTQKKLEIHPLRTPKTKLDVGEIEKSAEGSDITLPSDNGLPGPGVDQNPLGVERADDNPSPVEGAQPTASSPGVAKGAGQEASKRAQFGRQMQQQANKVAPKYGGFDLTKMSDEQVAALGRIFKMSGGEPRNADAIMKAAKVTVDGRPIRQVLELFTNNLLSGPATAQTVGASGAWLTAFEPAARILGGAITGNGALIREGADLLSGAAKYFKENVAIAAQSFREGRSVIDPAPQTIAIGGNTGQPFQTLGNAIRSPGSAIGAVHEFAKVTNYRAWVYAKSLREGRAVGLTGDALASYTDNNLRAAFSPEGIAVVPDALKYGQLTSLSTPLEKGSFGASLSQFTNNAVAAKFINPFVKVSTNIFKYTWQSAPVLNALNKQWRDVMLKGGEEAAILHARSLLATTIGGYAYTQAVAGNLTGRGPSDPKLRAMWLKDNQPYSFKVGGQWISYKRIEPLSMALGLMADAHQISSELGEKHVDSEQMLYAGIAALTSNMASKTFMQGITDFGQTWGSDNPQKVGQWMQNMAAGIAVPQFVNKLNSDPVYREAKTMRDAIYARVPGYSERLDPRYAWSGEPILKTGGAWNRLTMAPMQDATETPVEKAMLEMNQALVPMPPKMDNGIDLSDRTAFDNGKKDENGQPVSPYNRFMQLLAHPEDGNQSLRDATTELVKSPEWKDMSGGAEGFPGGERMLRVQRLKTQYERRALQQVREEYPKLDDQIKAMDQMKGAAITGGEDAVRDIESIFGTSRSYKK